MSPRRPSGSGFQLRVTFGDKAKTGPCVLSPGKAFEITYIRLKFYTSRPESFAIYKRTEQDGPWLPYQYYSSTCRKTYGKNLKTFIRPGDDEQTALCTDEFSDISPLTGGNVAFSTLEGRPSAYNYDQSLVLQVRAGPCSCSASSVTLRFQTRNPAHPSQPRETGKGKKLFVQLH